MNTIDYYREFLKIQNISLIENKWCKMKLNLYLMVNLDNCEKISICSNKNKQYFKYGTFANKDEYIIFIPYNEYRFVIMNGINSFMELYIYDHSNYFSTTNIEFINWFFNKEKLLLAVDFIKINCHMLYKQSPCTASYINLPCEGNSKLTKLINHMLKYCSYTNSNSFYVIYNEYKQIGYVNVETNSKYTLDKFCKSKYMYGSLYYFRIDKERSILLLSNKRRVLVLFYINDKIIIVNESFDKFEIIFKLMNRIDIYNFIKKR